MSGQLAVLSPDDVASADRLVEQFRGWEEQIRRTDEPSDVAEMVTQAKLIREAARIRKMASKVVRAAVRLEAFALRRLAQLGVTDPKAYGSSHARITGQEFARLSDEEMDRLLNGWGGSNGALARQLRDKRLMGEHVDDFRNGRVTPDSVPLWRRESAESIERSARNILEQIAPTDEPFTIAEAAEKLLGVLEVPYMDHLMEYACREVMAEALRKADPFMADDAYGNWPAYVTFQSSGGVWYRAPIESATAAQLRWMADYRAEQAEQVRRAAADLDRCARKAEAAAALHGLAPEEFFVRNVWRRQGDAVETAEGAAA